MRITKDFALKLWQAIYGDEIIVEDCFNTLIHRDDFCDENRMRVNRHDGKSYNYGWNIDHILPISHGGTNDLNNLEPMHIENNRIKENKTSFIIESIEYEIYKCKLSIDGYKGYGIQEKSSKKRVDWKYKLNKHF